MGEGIHVLYGPRRGRMGNDDEGPDLSPQRVVLLLFKGLEDLVRCVGVCVCVCVCVKVAMVLAGILINRGTGGVLHMKGAVTKYSCKALVLESP